MLNVTEIDQLIAAANMQLITFDHIPKKPVNIDDICVIEHSSARQIIGRYSRYGFAIFELGSELPTPDTLLGLGSIFELGEPFIPPLYLIGDDYKTAAVSKISVQGVESTHHPVFERMVEVGLHSDGTLQKIGYVKTTVMICESPGAEGGDTTLFNASAAFAELITNDLSAAVALASPGVLVRQANINGCRDINEGPAFTVQDGQLVCAYSVTETDKMVAANGVNERDLKRGVEFLRSTAQLGNRHFAQIRLAAGQGIILANSRISHGRTSYRNVDGHSHRCLYRGLYLKQPRIITTPVLATAIAS